MNACEDGCEPMGEAPEFERIPVGRAGVLGIVAAADEITATRELAEKQTAAIAALRDDHRRVSFSDGSGTYCQQCQTLGYPCATVRLLDEAGV